MTQGVASTPTYGSNASDGWPICCQDLVMTWCDEPMRPLGKPYPENLGTDTQDESGPPPSYWQGIRMSSLQVPMQLMQGACGQECLLGIIHS